ncbi:MAG TPA: hypothetical protein P5013_07255 [Methanoregula sp.]|nr:hypothetical protein [Methanoregula sp.]
MNKEFSWILLGIAAFFVVYIVGRLLNVDVTAIFAIIGINPVSFFAGIIVGIVVGYLLFTRSRGPGSGD